MCARVLLGTRAGRVRESTAAVGGDRGRVSEPGWGQRGGAAAV